MISPSIEVVVPGGWSWARLLRSPTCNVDTPTNGCQEQNHLCCHRRFLRTRHPQRSKFKEYYGSKEPTPKPRKFSELEIQLQISKVLKRRPGKHPDIAKKNPKPNREIELNWKTTKPKTRKGKCKTWKTLKVRKELCINSNRQELTPPHYNDDNANANEGNAEDGCSMHMFLERDDVVVSVEEESEPSTMLKKLSLR
ncbi:uncharacterized protein Tco_0633848 [Tanacetum coccineum]